MAHTIKDREYIFRARPKRTRPALAISVLGALSLVAASVGDSTADEAAISEPAAISAPTAVDAARVYGALGGPERFVLQRTERGALIRFLCKEEAPGCHDEAGEVGGSVATLRASSLADDLILTDTAGATVLSVAANGDVRLHAGNAVVPQSVPAKGRVVLPTSKTTADLAFLRRA